MQDIAIDERTLVVRTVPTAGPLRDELDEAGNPPIRWTLAAIGPARCSCCSSVMRRWSATVGGVALTISERDVPGPGPWTGVFYDLGDGVQTETYNDFELADLYAPSWAERAADRD